MAESKLIKVEVAYARPDKQWLIVVELEKGATVEQAILHSGVLKDCPEINLTKHKVGVFSKSRQLSDEVMAGDRVEIYRKLSIDPKEARRARAAERKAGDK